MNINTNETMKVIPEVLLDMDGYPTDEYLQFIKEYTSDTMPIIDFIHIMLDGWHYNRYTFKRQYKGKRKLVLHTSGWTGNEDTISAILSNIWLTRFKMKYVQWRVGGNYYFEITI